MGELERGDDLAHLTQSHSYVEQAQETVRRIQQAAAKGQVALLVTDAAGVVIVGIKGTGGMTKLQFKQDEGIWDAELHLSGVTILDGSYVLRAPFGHDPDDPDGMSDAEAEAVASRLLKRGRSWAQTEPGGPYQAPLPRPDEPPDWPGREGYGRSVPPD